MITSVTDTLHIPSYMLFLCTIYFQQIGLLTASILNALLSAACCVGLLFAIGVTIAHDGKGLMVGCSDTQVPINARSPIGVRCPFDTTRIYVSLKFPSLSVKHDFILFFKAWHEKGSTFISHFLLSTTSHLSGHHPGSVDPLCSVFGSWSGTVSVVLHGGTGSQGAATLQEQLHQRAGMYLCVGQMNMLEGYNFVVWLKHTHT